VVDSATFFVSAAGIGLMAVPHMARTARPAGGQLATVWAEMREGIVYLFGNRTMVGVLLCLSVVQLGLGRFTSCGCHLCSALLAWGPRGSALWTQHRASAWRWADWAWAWWPAVSGIGSWPAGASCSAAR